MINFEKLFQENQGFIFRYLMKLCGNESLAEELTQETFFRAYMNLTGLRKEEKVTVWLCQIAKNTYFTQYQRAIKAEQLGPEPKDSGSMEEKLENRETAYQIHKILHHLPEPYKEVFSLRAFGELSFKQIGELFGKTESWARVTYHRAKIKIKEELQ